MKQTPFIFGILLPTLLLSSCGEASSVPPSSASSSLPSSTSSQGDGSIALLAENLAKFGTHFGIATTGTDLLSKAELSGQESTLYSAVYRLFYQEFKDTMPEFKGARRFGAAPKVELTGVPADVAPAIAFLQDHGLYTPTSGATDWADGAMSEIEIATYCDRFSAYYGTSLKDDYFSTVNHDALYENSATAEIEPSTSHYRTSIVDAKVIQNWVGNLLKETGSNPYLQSAQAFEETLLDTASRKDATHGILNAVNSILNTTSEASFLSAVESLSATQYYDPLFVDQDYLGLTLVSGDSIEECMLFNAGSFDTKVTDFSDDSTYLNGYRDWAKAIFLGLGISDSKATQLAAGYRAYIKGTLTSFLKTHVGGSLSIPNAKDITYGQDFNVYQHLIRAGFSDVATEKGGHYFLRSSPWAKASFDTLFGADSTLAMKQGLALMNEVKRYYLSLPTDALKAYEKSDTLPTDYFSSLSLFKGYVSEALSKDIVGYYTPSASYTEAVTLAQTLFKDAQSAFSARMAGESWLSSNAIAASQVKLSAMKACLFGTFKDGSKISYDSPNYIALANGGTFFLNQVAYDPSLYLYHQALIGTAETFESAIAAMNPLTANAFYLPNRNGLYVTLGYLASKDNFVTMSKERFYSELGWALCHEMTHGFDTNGIFYNAQGQYDSAWWSNSDRLTYVLRALDVETHYDGAEVYPGEATDGTTILSEAVADLGGIRLCLDLAKKESSFDYDAFWKDAATTFCSEASRSFYEAKLAKDVHPFGRVRVNCAFNTFDEFVNTYSLAPGDLMYVEPAGRPAIW